MQPYRKTVCQDLGFSKGMAFFLPLDLRKKYYFCHHCQKEHLTKEGYQKPATETVGKYRVKSVVKVNS